MITKSMGDIMVLYPIITNCFDCLNCLDCFDCLNCLDCFDCLNCLDCFDCPDGFDYRYCLVSIVLIFFNSLLF